LLDGLRSGQGEAFCLLAPVIAINPQIGKL
jgi:hypothetical protein